MSNVHAVPVQPLTVRSFAPFGQAILGASRKSNYHGAEWSSLFPAGKTHIPQGEIGWVLTRKPQAGYVVAGMEREPEVEIIWTVDKPIIQTVTPPGNLTNHKEQPKAEDVKAFLILPGQVIIMHPGTWHYAAFAIGDEETLYYFITKDHLREPGWETIPWIPFIGNRSVIVQE